MWQWYGGYFMTFYGENKLLENIYASKIKLFQMDHYGKE